MKLYYCTLSSNKTLLLPFLKASLPEHVFTSSSNYLSISERALHLVGRWMIKKAIEDFHLSLTLHDIEYSEYGKPHFNDKFHFSISHSNNIVVGFFSTQQHVGVDTQYHIPINWADYRNVLSPTDMELIVQSSDKKKIFFELWSTKESIVKAEGTGISTELSEVQLIKNGGFLKSMADGEKWETRIIKIQEGYSTSICAKHLPAELSITKLIIP